MELELASPVNEWVKYGGPVGEGYPPECRLCFIKLQLASPVDE